MKKSLSILLALLLLFYVFPVTSFAAQTEISRTGAAEDVAAVSADEDLSDVSADADIVGTGYISEVELQMTEPKAGATPAVLATPIRAYNTYYVNGVVWYQTDPDNNVTQMGINDVYRAGYKYSAHIFISVSEGFEFYVSYNYSCVHCTVNDRYAHAGKVNGERLEDMLCVTCDFGTLEDTGLKSVQASIAKPYPHQYPSYYAWVPLSNPGYEVEDYDTSHYRDGVRWIDETSQLIIEPSDPVKFVAGHKYAVTISLVPKEGYAFYKTTSEITGKVNSNTAAVGNFGNTADADRNISITYTFTCEYAPLSSVAVTGITVPVSGENPSYTAPDVADSSKYSIMTDYNDDHFTNGVAWYDKSTGYYISEGIKFKDDHTYRCYITVKAGDIYVFSDPVSATVNGNSATVLAVPDRNSKEYRMLACDFVVKKGIASVTVSGVTAPVAGQSPKFSASIPSGVNYKIEPFTNGNWVDGVIWKNETDNTYLNSSDKFVKGKKYRVTVSLITAADNFAFMSNVTGTLNGSSAVIQKYGNGTANIGVSYTFSLKETVSSVAVTVTAPKPGQKPVFSATVPSSAGYAVRSDYNNSIYKNGVQWGTVGSYIPPDSSYTFEYGKQYTVTVLLKPKDSTCEFASGVTGTVNGKAAVVKVSGSNSAYRYIEYTFPATPEPPVQKYTVSGNITSFLDDSGTVELKLLDQEVVKDSTTAVGNVTTYKFEGVSSGTYTLRVSKANHVDRDYTITVSGNTTQNVKIHPKGDISGDGRITSKDFAMAYAHAQKLDTLTRYALKCGDVVKNDGQVKTADAARIYAHAQKLDLLW